jgi:hypothetical protein
MLNLFLNKIAKDCQFFTMSWVIELVDKLRISISNANQELEQTISVNLLCLRAFCKMPLQKPAGHTTAAGSIA